MNIVKFSRTSFLQYTSGGCFCIFIDDIFSVKTGICTFSKFIVYILIFSLVVFLDGRQEKVFFSGVFKHMLLKYIHMMMTMNCFGGMVDQRKAFSLISSRDQCQRSSLSRISNTSRAGFEPTQNLSLSLVEGGCAVVVRTTHIQFKFVKFWFLFFYVKIGPRNAKLALQSY